jgi:hypothetical protein
LFFRHALRQISATFKGFVDYADPNLKITIEEFLKRPELNPSDFESEDEEWDNWWGKKGSIWTLASETKLKSLYNSQFVPLSNLVHGAPAVFNHYLSQQNEDRIEIDSKAEPLTSRVEALAEVMFTAAPTGLLDLLSVLAGIWGFNYETEFDAALRTLEAYKKEEPMSS